MKNLTYEVKIATIRILTDILNADNIVHKKEVDFLKQVVKSFEISDSYQSVCENLTTSQALSIIKELAPFQKETITSLMGKMIVVDKDINYNEVILYNEFCKCCDISKTFNPMEFPEYTLSGPFVDPEDLISKV